MAFPGAPLRVQLADADREWRERIQRDLVRAGFDCECSGPGIAAIHHAFQYWPDVIVVRRGAARMRKRLDGNGYLKHMHLICCRK